MKQETMVLTDNQMTNLIHQKAKGDLRHKDAVRDDWLIFSYKMWQNGLPLDKFIEKMNEWLAHHKLPAQVLNFTRFDEDNEDPDAVEWEVQIASRN